MPSLENLRINHGETSFIYPAIETAAPPAALNTPMPARTADLTITTSDIIDALGFAPAPLNSAMLTGNPTAPTPVLSDNSTALATTAFVLEVVSAITGSPINIGGTSAITTVFGRVGDIVLQASDVTGALGFSVAPLSSPAFIGSPTAPTVAISDSSGKLATTAFAQNLFASNTGSLRSATIGSGLTLSGNVLSANVTAVFGRTGTVGLTAGDITGALSFTPASLISPAFHGVPTAPTPLTSDNSTTVATTAFVQGLLASAAHNLSIQQIGTGLSLTSGVLTATLTSVFGRTGAIVLAATDVETALAFTPAPLLSPIFLGLPVAPTPLLGDNSNTLATTAFVAAAIAPINLIQFVGSGLSLASGTLTARITTVFGRTGAIVLTATDVTTALAYLPAPSVSPSFIGTPTAPTALSTDNSTKLATTSFVQSAIQGGSQTVSVQAQGGLINTALATRFGRTLSLIDDFNATGNGFTDDTNAVIAWVAAVLSTGAIGLAPTGTYSISRPLVIDWATGAKTGAMFIGTGSSRCVISCSASATSPAFLLTNSGGQSAYYGKILGIGFTGSLPGVVLQIGQTVTPLCNFAFDIAVTNGDPTSASCCVNIPGLSDSSLTLVATCLGRGNVLRIIQASNCTFMGSLGRADTGIYLTSGMSTGNVFQAMDIGTVNACVMIDSSLAENNTFIGGQFDWDTGSGIAVAAIDATAGSNNRFINVNFPSVGNIVTGNVGISIDGTPYSTLTSGGMTVVPVLGSPSTLSVLATNGNSLVTSQADIGNASMLISTNAGQAALTLDCGGFGNATLLFSKFTSSRWQLAATTTNEVGPNAGTDLILTRFNDNGTALDTPLAIGQSTGITTLSGLSVIGTAALGAIVSTTLAASTSFSTDSAAESGGVPLGGFYRNGNVVQIRVQSAVLAGEVDEVGVATDTPATLVILADVEEIMLGLETAALLPVVVTSSDTGAVTDSSGAAYLANGGIGETGAVIETVSHL
jgi:hypothetical protein